MACDRFGRVGAAHATQSSCSRASQIRFWNSQQPPETPISIRGGSPRLCRVISRAFWPLFVLGFHAICGKRIVSPKTRGVFADARVEAPDFFRLPHLSGWDWHVPMSSTSPQGGVVSRSSMLAPEKASLGAGNPSSVVFRAWVEVEEKRKRSRPPTCHDGGHMACRPRD